MIYIERIVLHNFKSFRHASIRLTSGFNCIVGPNGSGKSSICDALFFALGEQSLKRMRINSTAELINENAKKDEHTYVKVVFGGDESFEVEKSIENNSIVYRIDEKRATRQDVVNILNQKGSNINETNTVAQGEIGKLQALSAKGRRELIDIAAGIKEFDVKKEDALKELEKVEAMLANAQGILNERIGFLEELRKEKEQAEKYNALTEEAKRISYTLLARRKRKLEEDYKKIEEERRKLLDEMEKLENDAKSISNEIEKLAAERESRSKMMNEHAGGSSSKGAYDSISKAIAELELKASGIGHDLGNMQARMEEAKKEIEGLAPRIAGNEENIAMLLKEEEEAMKGIAAGGNSIELEELSREYQHLSDSLQEMEGKLATSSNDYSNILFEMNAIDKDIARASEEMEGKERKKKEIDEARKSKDAKRKEIAEKRANAVKEITSLNSNANALMKRLGELQKEAINIREQMAMAGSSIDKIEALLKEEISGFYGSAGELCTYDSTYAVAISAAGGARLNYFIVDSIDVADRCIKLLKESKAGRATFIPLQDIKASKEEAKEGMLINFVRFDKKFENAFRYIFAGTYLVKSIGEAKERGIGNGRYVTLEGELVEQSGVVSGGAIKPIASAGALRIKMDEANKEIESINASLEAIESSKEEARKRLADIEAEAVKLDVEESYAGMEEQKQQEEIEAIAKKLEELSGKKAKLQEFAEKLKKEKENLSMSIEEARKSERNMYERLTGSIVKEGSNSIEEARKRAEAARIKKAELSKENELLKARLEASRKAFEDAEKAFNVLMQEKSAIEKEMEKKREEKSAIEKEMDKENEEMKKLYGEFESINQKISSNEIEKGKLQAAMERIGRQVMEKETAKAQLEVRIGDIKAEFAGREELAELDGNEEELSKKLEQDKEELSKMGNINLKAPELYEEKKKDVDEAQGKLDVLKKEKASVINMIEQIETRKRYVFEDTLARVNKNFKDLYKQIFEGEAELILSNPKNEFDSGLMIDIKDAKGKHKNFATLSGGERDLMIIMIVMAIQMQKPMAFYVFDEIDASLDKDNSEKLSMLISKISKKSQFIVVTHNDQMLKYAETYIGVAKQNGVSSAVGMTAEQNVSAS
ncbi:MAG: AAA family ATPase [Candidatus Micrarchaeaceae archaeon]